MEVLLVVILYFSASSGLSLREEYDQNLLACQDLCKTCLGVGTLNKDVCECAVGEKDAGSMCLATARDTSHSLDMGWKVIYSYKPSAKESQPSLTNENEPHQRVKRMPLFEFVRVARSPYYGGSPQSQLIGGGSSNSALQQHQQYYLQVEPSNYQPFLQRTSQMFTAPPYLNANAGQGLSPPYVNANAGQGLLPPYVNANAGQGLLPPYVNANAGQGLLPPYVNANAGQGLSPPYVNTNAGSGHYPQQMFTSPPYLNANGPVHFPQVTEDLSGDVRPPQSHPPGFYLTPSPKEVDEETVCDYLFDDNGDGYEMVAEEKPGYEIEQHLMYHSMDAIEPCPSDSNEYNPSTHEEGPRPQPSEFTDSNESELEYDNGVDLTKPNAEETFTITTTNDVNLNHHQPGSQNPPGFGQDEIFGQPDFGASNDSEFVETAATTVKEDDGFLQDGLLKPEEEDTSDIRVGLDSVFDSEKKANFVWGGGKADYVTASMARFPENVDYSDFS